MSGLKPMKDTVNLALFANASEILYLGNFMGLEVDEANVNNLVKEHQEKLSTEELIELQRRQHLEMLQELSSKEEVEPEELLSSRDIKEVLVISETPELVPNATVEVKKALNGRKRVEAAGEDDLNIDLMGDGGDSILVKLAEQIQPHSSIMTKHRVSPKRHSSGCRILPMILTMTGVMMILIPAVENTKDILYQIGEVGTRGSEVLAQSFAATSRSTCAGACLSAQGCVGFNWMPTGTPKCELLSSLRMVTSSTISDIYVTDRFKRTAIKLEYSCPTCMGPQPVAFDYWEHRCEANAVVVGIASLTSFPDLDYLLCGYFEGLRLVLANGFTCADDTRGCNTVSVVEVAFDCLWGNTQYYDPAGSLRYACREIDSGHSIDRSRCINPTETYGLTSGISSHVKMFLCPPHMLAQRLYASASVPAYVICCLFY
ncbi:uncharacterized protein [Palaemon carinicauda]|uniref:uncharacterized protein n=1 Tax=Palaemon carinicauda TaxID=392227 RepID=UPI0035B5A0BC